MLEGYLSTLFLIGSIYGFSGFLKKILGQSKEIFNIDYIYGLLFLTIISLFLNLFLPLKYFSLFFLLIGFILFLNFVWLKYLRLNFYILFLITFVIVFISHNNGVTYDSQLYHLQLLQLNSNYKSIFGIANLQPHYAMNSSWHSLLGLINLKLLNVNFADLANLSILIIFINESLINHFHKKNKLLSSFFLLLTVLYILIYSFFHPYGNGTILNLLGSPEADLSSAIFFIISIYLLIKYYEDPKKQILNLILISSFLLITIKISYIGVFLVIIYAIFYKKYNFYFFEKLNWFLLFGSIFWFAKSFLSSGCLIFPIGFTCIPVSWSQDLIEVESYANIVQSFARDTPLRLNFTNFDYTLNSWQWFIPWIKEYFFETEFLLVSFILIFVSLFYFIFYLIYKQIRISVIFKNFYFHLLILIILNLFIWFKAPEIRFGYGSIISLVCFLISLLFFISFKNFFVKKRLFNLIILIAFGSILFKNFDNFKHFNNVSFVRNFDYSNFENIYNINNYKVYKPVRNNFCNSFEGFCTYQGFKVNIEKKNGYIFMRRSK